jgi:hypothetical protein
MWPRPQVDDSCSLLPLGLGLPRHRALHAFWQLDVRELDEGDLDTPGDRADVEDLPDVKVDVVGLRRVSSRVCRSTTLRSVVCAIWSIAARTCDHRLYGVGDAKVGHAGSDCCARSHAPSRTLSRIVAGRHWTGIVGGIG